MSHETVKGLYTPEDAARYLSMSRARLYHYLSTGELQSLKIGRSRRLTLDQLTQFIDRYRK